MSDPITIWAPTSIRQTTRERLAEAIRLGGIRWREQNDPEWRGKPWMDGVLVDLNEDGVVETIIQRIVELADPDTEES
ncbi:hypothetical protein SEA_WATERT_7 [Microbacterium phage WaterT]|nr:hypothetical protein SEA_WATERT_7 [Microbacterium phage WaterT]